MIPSTAFAIFGVVQDQLVKAKFHYADWLRTSSEHVQS